jgi:hypothetical protein
VEAASPRPTPRNQVFQATYSLGVFRLLRVVENRVLRRIFGPKRDEVTGGWRKLNNEELQNLYTSPSIIIEE